MQAIRKVVLSGVNIFFSGGLGLVYGGIGYV